MVLAILAVVSTVAITRVGGASAEIRDGKSEARVLEIAGAIVGDVEGRLRDGTVRDARGEILQTSFLSDTGRLPRAVPRTPTHPGDVADGTLLTLDELVVKPEGLSSWRTLLTNLTVRADGLAVGFEDVPVSMGWRGPYIRHSRSAGDSYVNDGYGCGFSVVEGSSPPEDAAAILPADGAPLTNGFEIAAVRASRRIRECTLTNAFARGVSVSFRMQSPASVSAYGFLLCGPDGTRGGVRTIERHALGAASTLTVPDAVVGVGLKTLCAWVRPAGAETPVKRVVSVYLSDSGILEVDF